MKTLIVAGDARAEAIVRILRLLPEVTDRYAVEHVETLEKLSRAHPKGCVAFEQVAEGANATRSEGIEKHVCFPALAFDLLWPFDSINPFNEPDPPEFPHGRFPYGDSFLLACLEQGLSSIDALWLYFGDEWGESWPDLDALFRKESARLTALDARFGLGIGSYILKHFRRQRLFLTAESPTDLLLAELTARLLAAAFPKEGAVAQADIRGAIASLGMRDCLGAFSLPVHPLVAKHFQLTWLSPNARYNHFDREQLTSREYYSRFIEDALAHGAGQAATTARTAG